MAEIKDKVITGESLKVLHEYNQETYETKEEASLNLTTIENNLAAIEDVLDTKLDKPENNIIPIENGGTNSADGATGLANLLAAGATVLSSNQYGDELPEAGTVGRIFFKKLSE